MSDKLDRKAELERKKARLAQIRADKQRKKKDQHDEEPKITVSSELERKRKETEDLLRAVGIEGDSSKVVTVNTSPKKKTETNSVHHEHIRPRPRRIAKLEISKLTVTSIPPREIVKYAKETQTPIEKPASDDEDNQQNEEEIIEHLQEQERDEIVEAENPPTPREMSDEEKKSVESSIEYSSFLTRTSRFMERALVHKIDLFTEYNLQTDEESEMDKDSNLSVSRIFSDERWSRYRFVTCIDWSQQHPELCAAAYSTNEEASYEPDGVALVWNTKYKTTTPEYIFHCQSPVTAVCFAKYQPNILIGGTHSGQIVIWDTRSNKRTPVQRSKLSATAHTHPVFCIEVVGTPNAHNLISLSNDGKMRSWSLDMLTQPQDAMELQNKQTKLVAVTCMSFQPNNVNNFAVGAEDGSVYTACRHGSKTGISESFEGHFGPVSGIDFNRAPGQLDFSHLFLTSSFDWTVKLWSVKNGSRTCLHSFEDSSDYVLDVAWSPMHPALFASGTGSGVVNFWNLNNDIEVPAMSVQLDGSAAVNKIKWNGAGTQIACADDLGRLHMCEIGENVGVPRNDEWARFVRTVTEIKNNLAEEEEAQQISQQL